MKEIESDPHLTLQLIVSGTHLEKAFGETWRQIDSDGFRIDAKIFMKLDSDRPAAIAKSMGLALAGCAEALERLKPDIMVVLGDRYEALAAAEAATLCSVPLAHIHGGEASEGAIDDAMRHAITKLSHLHFTAAESYRQRIIQMGESVDRVFNVGAPGLDHIARVALATREQFEHETGFRFGEQNIVVTYHPETLSAGATQNGISALLSALEKMPDVHVLFTKANADFGGRLVNAAIEAWVKHHDGRALLVHSLGQRLYLSAIALCDAVVGNSSSGLIEAPALGRPTANIGARQNGRLRASSVIDCAADAASIEAAISRALLPEARLAAERGDNPYGMGGASARIKAVLSTAPIDGLLNKSFNDHHSLPSGAT